ncbi:hypothetical protein PTSG_04802 [Salpingoeca rosetta]|uniref:Uncharacterized protein n=1 Tax=Salpingoeca rosetta (strain ATCC 50818 / BSB-021) TaxID=946362 RepID=F2U9R1_SALR5|nr:uncharacterized protein PTSG_04802 [Salpingoeca rosetta]EGD73088.1 hypothetical protein PTSG_04802 [Salpingoeca rosetta]|eukprot:XP_004994119.1 hypothetical protein PTSG_04802 [Salpingoeca rosetta]
MAPKQEDSGLPVVVFYPLRRIGNRNYSVERKLWVVRNALTRYHKPSPSAVVANYYKPYGALAALKNAVAEANQGKGVRVLIVCHGCRVRPDGVQLSDGRDMYLHRGDIMNAISEGVGKKGGKGYIYAACCHSADGDDTPFVTSGNNVVYNGFGLGKGAFVPTVRRAVRAM